MRLRWVAIGVVGLVGIGLAMVGPSGSGTARDDADESALSRMATVTGRGRDLTEGMSVSTSERSMFTPQGRRGERPDVRRAGAIEKDDSPTSSHARRTTRTTRGGASGTDARQTAASGRQQSFRDRQAERAREIAERRAALRNPPGAQDPAPRTNRKAPAMRERLQELRDARASNRNTRVTGGRVAQTNRGLIGQNQRSTPAGTSSPSGAAGNDSATEKSRGLDQSTADQLLEQLLAQTGKKNSGGGGGVVGSSAGSGSSSGATDGGSSKSGASSSGGSESQDGPTQTVGGGGGGGGGAGQIEGSGPTAVSSTGLVRANLRWIPIEMSACTNLSGARSNDLYLRMDGPDRLIAVDSGGSSSGLEVVGGGFVQQADGSSMPPDTGAIAGDPCLAFDTYLDFGGTSFSILTSGGASFESGSGAALVATWVSLTGVQGTQSQARFGDAAYYIRLGRFTAQGSVTSATGDVLVQVVPSEGGAAETLTLSVPQCESCWGGDGTTSGSGDSDADNDDGSGNGGSGSGDDGTADDDGSSDDNGGTGDADDGGSSDDGNDNGGSDVDDNGGGSTDGGSGGDGASGDDGSSDDGTSGDGTDSGDDTPMGIEALWLPIDNACDPTGFDGCEAPTAFATYDLYLRMGQPDRITILDLGSSSSGLDFGSAEVWQVARSDGNAPLRPRPPILPPRCPCEEFDSYFAFGSASSFSFFVQPEPGFWLSPLEAVWYGNLGTTVQAAQAQGTFGDEAYYFRIMRLTIEPDAEMGGNVLVLGTSFGTSESFAVEVDIPPLPGE